MTAQTPVYGIKYIVEGEPARNTRAALQANAETIEAALIAGGIAPAGASDIAALSGRVSALEGGTWTAYNPTWACSVGAPAVGNGILSGRYRKVGKTVNLQVDLTFGSTTSGGTGDWSFTLPVAAVTGREQELSVKGWCGDGNFGGAAYISSGGSIAIPLAPENLASTPRLSVVRNATSGGAPGTGVPFVSGNYSFSTNHNLHLFGTYEAAS